MKLLFGGYAYCKHRVTGLHVCPVVVTADSEYEAMGRAIVYAKERWLPEHGYFEHNAELIQADQGVIDQCATH